MGWRGSVGAVLASLVVVAGLTVGGCSGGGDGGGDGAGDLLAISFVAFPEASGGATGSGPNSGVPLPEVFVNQALELAFDAPVDAGIFGGLTGAFEGAAGDGQGGIPYAAYADQQAAAQSLQVLENVTGAPLGGYVVGRHRDKANTLVLDPRMRFEDPLGFVPAPGYFADTEYVLRIPASNGILVGGAPARPWGPDPAALPLVYSIAAPPPVPSPLFRSGSTLAPDPIPPEVVAITLASGAAGTVSDPAPVTDTIVVTFSKAIDPVSLDVLANFVIFNTDTASHLPGNLVIDPSQTAVTFTPIPGFGPGQDPLGGVGYQIEVRVGSFGQPASVVPPILGLPMGTPPATQLPLGNSLARTFVTAPTPGAPGSATVLEEFETTGQMDQAFQPNFAPVVWGTDPDPARAEQLLGEPITGSPLGTYLGVPLGSRTQVTVTPQPLSTSPPALFSPFDDAFGNCLIPPGSAFCVNPNGGSHIMHGYEAVDLANTRSSLELVEWGPLQNFVIGTVYPTFQVWCGMTSFSFPLTPLTGGCCGLSAIYATNYNLPTNQDADPNGQGGVQCTPGAIPYSTGVSSVTASGYFPFPVFANPFDYFGSGPGQGNLVLEMNIEPGNQVANFNRYRATANTPVRRLLGSPLSAGLANAQATGFDIYDMRFTFVTMESQGQSLFYDTHAPVGVPPVYPGIFLMPSPMNQPPGTRARWEFEGATALLGPGTPAPGQSTGFVTYFDGGPLSGAFDPSALTTLGGNRFFRYRVTLRNNNVTNANQAYDSLLVGVSF